MKIFVHDIDYDITVDDIEGEFDAFLEIADLDNYTGDIATTDIERIEIRKDIIDTYEYSKQLLLGYADGYDQIAFLYQMDAENDNSIFAHKVAEFSYEEMVDDIKSTLENGMILKVDDEDIAGMSDDELDSFICDLISDETDFLLNSFEYEISEE